VTGPHPNYCFYVSPPAFCARLCCFLRVQLWTSESTKHANDAGTSKSSPSFWRSCRPKLTKEVYRFSPIWHISSVKITRALDDAVPFSNDSRQQWPWRYGNRGLLPPLQFRILASSRANAFCNDRRAEAKIPENGRNCSTAAERGCFLRVSCSQRVKECETLENVEARLVTGAGFLRHALQYG
jgi:hypothetical protein